MKKINQSGYLAIVVTNQPVIARGEATFEELNTSHNKMRTLLGKGCKKPIKMEEGGLLEAVKGNCEKF